MKYHFIPSLSLAVFCLLAFPPCALSQPKIPGCTPAVGTSPCLYVNPQTPNATGLGKYGDCPVSFFTGRPNISIPLYNFKSRNVTMPISLDYDAGGVLVNSLPGWVGQNWTLNVGGVITRKVNNREDEYIYSSHADLPFVNIMQSYFQCPNKIISLWQQSNDDHQNLKADVTYKIHDLSPDIFTFHFMGKSGKFFLGNDGNWKVQSDENLEVIFDYTDPSNFMAPLFSKFPVSSEPQPKVISGFRIKDENGNVYYFGYNRNAVEYTINFWDMTKISYNDSWRASSWYLSKVTDRFGNILFNLEYERGAYLLQIFFSYFMNSTTADSHGSGAYIYISGVTSQNSDFPYTIAIHSPVYLTRITGAGITVDIKSSYVPDKLATDSIYESFCRPFNHNKYTIFNDLKKKTKKYLDLYHNTSYQNDDECFFYYLTGTYVDSLKKFRYSPQQDVNIDLLGHTRMKQVDYIAIKGSKPRYFVLNHSYKRKRLWLDGITLQDSPTNSSAHIAAKYLFTYDRFEELPEDYLTTRVDHWGYYNNIQYIDPEYCTWPSAPIQTRLPNLYYCKMGSLAEIQYPTGGTSVFDYELNTYGKVLSENRQYTINKNGTGGGLRIKSIKEYDSPSHTKLLKSRSFEYKNPDNGLSSGELFAVPKYAWSLNLPCEVSNNLYNITMHQSSSIVPLANSFGPSLGYKYVTEIINDHNNPGNQIRKTVYRYSNLSDLNTNDLRSEPLYSNYPDSTPFDEYSELGFKRGQLLSKVVYDANNDSISITKHEYRSDNYLDNHYTYTSNIEHDNGINGVGRHFTRGVYKLYYPKYDIVKTTEKVKTSSGSYLTTVTEYDKEDFTIADGTAEVRKCNAVTTARKSGNTVLESVKEEYTYPMNDTNFINDYYFPPIKCAKSWNGNVIKTEFTYFTKRMFLNGQHMVPSRETEAIGPSAPYTGNGISGYTILTYDTYDQSGSLTQYTPKGMAPTHLTWDTHGRLKSKQTGSLTKSYSYKSEGQLVGITGENGFTTHYGYDSFGRLAYARDTLGILQRYSYNYKMSPYNDTYSDESPDTTEVTVTPEPSFTVVQSTCSASVVASNSQNSQQKTFEIFWTQDVTISVTLSTQRASTSLMAAINRSSSNGTYISNVYNCSGSGETVNTTYTVRLDPGTYMLSARTPHYDGDSSTKASISATFKTYAESQ